VDPVTPSSTGDKQREHLVQCDKFILDRLQLSEPHIVPNDNRFHILAVVEGSVSIASHKQNFNLPRGGTVLVPATTREVKIAPQDRAVVLDMYLP
jgi:mannose-6-phosphate isomerase